MFTVYRTTRQRLFIKTINKHKAKSQMHVEKKFWVCDFRDHLFKL